MIAKLQTLVSWFCTCLGITLIGCGVLVVPERALADWVSDCQNGCCTACFGSGTCDTLSSCYNDCLSECYACAMNCNYDPTCIANNCQVKMCPGDPCEVKSECFQIDYTKCPKTYTGLCDKMSNCTFCICKKLTGYDECACRLKIAGD